VARSIPLLPVVPAEPRRFAPRLPILSGQGASADYVGHWYDLARELNLSLATGNASVVFECNYPDNQFWVASVGFLTRTRFALPPCSGYHTVVRVSVYGNTPTAGTVRFNSTNGAATVDIVLPGVVGWTDSPALGHLAVAFAGAPSYEEVVIQTDGDCNIDIIKVEYLDVNPGGLWPGLDDALPAGPVPGSARNANPMDDAEVGFDKPLSAGVGLNALRNLQDIEERERVYLNIAAFNPGIVGGVDAVMATFPHRVVVPVLAERTTPVRLTLAVYAEATAGAFEFYVSQRGGLGLNSTPPRDAETFTMTAGFGSWRFFTFELSAGHVHEAPAHYAGFTTLSVKPEFALALQHVKSVAMWSR